ncbi:MAG: GTPase HflX [Ignavibacteria bacterium]|nr:GTPase HflX [Ignavibacteria bacterium]
MQLIKTNERERAVLVAVAPQAAVKPGYSPRKKVQEHLDELAQLAESAGAVIVDRIIQERKSIHAAYFIGRGKAEELACLAKEKNIDVIIFDDDLSAVQVRNLERLIKCKIVDRSGIILDIFASRARTRESKTQVELAQLQYMLPRLTRQWTHLSKQFGGIGTKGPGETQIETDRRTIRTKITHLNAKLERIDKERMVQRRGRKKFPRVALVGYTNAGKSTLLNWFSQADVVVEDKLFATLDSTVRLVNLSSAHKILLSDTVGFIRKLPHHLVASFKSTLDEVTEADILLHVVDVSHPLFEEQIVVVDETLEEIGANGKPKIVAFNKIDKIEDRSIIRYLSNNNENAVFISGSRGINIGSLQEKIVEMLEKNISEQTVTLKQDDYQIISQIHDMAEITDKQYNGDEITIRFRMNKMYVDRLRKVLSRKTAQ